MKGKRSKVGAGVILFAAVLAGAIAPTPAGADATKLCAVYKAVGIYEIASFGRLTTARDSTSNTFADDNAGNPCFDGEGVTVEASVYQYYKPTGGSYTFCDWGYSGYGYYGTAEAQAVTCPLYYDARSDFGHRGWITGNYYDHYYSLYHT